MEKADVDSIDGLSPAISIDQKTTSKNPRSTVGTVAEIHDYLRLLYARVGVAHCPRCGREISKQTVDQMVDQLLALPERTRMLLSPVCARQKRANTSRFWKTWSSGNVASGSTGKSAKNLYGSLLAKPEKAQHRGRH